MRSHGSSGRDRYFAPLLYEGQYTLKLTNLAGRGITAAGLGMQISLEKGACARILHGVSCHLSLNP